MTRSTILKLILPVFCLGIVGAVTNSVSALENIKEQNNTISLSVTTQCSFVVVGGELNNNYDATGANGHEATFTNNNGVHNFNVACNEYAGYTIKAYAEDLINTEDPTNTIAFYNYSEYTPRMTNNSGAGIWSAEITSGGDDNAIFGTDAEHMEIIKSRDTASELDGDTFSIQYHAYVGRTTAPGLYQGKAVYTIIPNTYTPTKYMYTITYHANGIAGTPATEYGEVNLGETYTKTISDTVLSMNGKTFLGWDTSPTANTVTYTPEQSITISETNANINLYAVWSLDSTMANGNYLQGMTATSCANVALYSVSNTTYQLTDIRDGHSYLVRKLDDGNCWMVQNLSLFARTSISAANTDLNGTTEENNTFITNWNNATVVSAGANQWTNDKTVYQVYNGTYQPNTKNTTVEESNTPTTNTGSYYPFIVATAGYDIDATEGNATSSICPKGWKLPTSGASGQFKTLYDAYDGANDSSSTSTLQLAMDVDNAYFGRCYASNCPSALGNATLWSSTIYDTTGGHRLYASVNKLDPTSYGNKYDGLPIRCMLPS